MMRKLLVTISLLLLLDTASALRVIEQVERAVELTLGELSLPDDEGGTVSFSECADLRRQHAPAHGLHRLPSEPANRALRRVHAHRRVDRRQAERQDQRGCGRVSRHRNGPHHAGSRSASKVAPRVSKQNRRARMAHRNPRDIAMILKSTYELARLGAVWALDRGTARRRRRHRAFHRQQPEHRAGSPEHPVRHRQLGQHGLARA